MKNKQVTLISILESEIPLKDKFWFVCKKLATKQQNKQIAINVAEIVLPIFEKRYPSNKSIRDCIETAKLFISGHTTIEKLIKHKRDMADVVYAAYVAYAYAINAANAANATNAAANAANATNAAANAANADVHFNEKLLKFLIDFCYGNS